MIFEKSIKKQSKKRKKEGGGVVEGVGALDNIKKKKEVVFNVLCRTLTLGN